MPSEDLASYSARGESGATGAVSGNPASGAGGNGGSSSPDGVDSVNTPEFPGATAGGLDPGLGFAGAGGARPSGSLEDAGAPSASGDAGADAGSAFCSGADLTGPNGSCFSLQSTARSWADARSACLALGNGWDLASIRSEAINTFLSDALSFEAWIGASDAATEGAWTWVIDGAPFWSGTGAMGSAVAAAYNSWNTSEPNGGTNSDCARILPGALIAPGAKAIWADLECAQLRGSVCERLAP
jgi:hypothetical protein